MSEERRKQYPFARFEPKWQAVWDGDKTFRARNPGDDGFDPAQPKFYVLDMFPYPSGAGLHVGHPEGYTATDIVARYKRMRGFNVLHPMGWDAFGLPAEQYAIKTGQHPAITTAENVGKFKEQLKRIGFSYDWDREVNTTDPGYYKWTQWIFLQLYNAWFDPDKNKARPICELIENRKSKIENEPPESLRAFVDGHRLAYVSEAPVNWCPELGTVLANEEVIDGKSEVGGFPVERRPMRQWMLRITAYCERLINELDGLDWPESIRLLQRNWIGRSEGAEVHFKVASASLPMRGGEHRLEADATTIRVFTTRPDTLFGATYMVLAPEHRLVDEISTEEQMPAIEEYRAKTARKSDLERTELAKEKSGVFTGGYAINPVNNERIPIWIADYVLLGYGTGAIMAVPAHDERDFEFAQKYSLPVRQVVRGIGFQPMSAGHGLEADATFQPMQTHEPVEMRRGACLPHWTQEGATYSVCFRLADSLPQQVVEDWQQERRELLRAAAQSGEALTSAQETRLAELFSEKVDAFLDAGHGDCVLNDSRIASLVQDALLYFHDKRYRLHAWSVMPNHVHAIVQPLPGHELSGILHSWKSFTASEANVRLGRSGQFWQPESYDHIIRTENEFRKQVRYVLDNPEKAGLTGWSWTGVASASLPMGDGEHRLEADATKCFTGDGVAINSPLIDGLLTTEAKTKITDWLEAKGIGKRAINYKLRDWLFSRQRYWGEPFPIVWRDGKHEALPESELPLVPPVMDDFKPTGTAEPPLAKLTDWIRYSDTATRETNTMPQWAGSCWYYLRYIDPKNSGRFVGEEAERYWMGSSGIGIPADEQRGTSAGSRCHGGVDLYVGGTEHAVLHLLYARFWHKVLHDLGHVSTPEPFQKLVNQGIILGEDGQKMSKSRGNVVNPDIVIGQYGADALRCYEMFMGPLEQTKPWSMAGVEGVYRFLARVWRLVMEEQQDGSWALSPLVQDAEPTGAQLRVIHATIKKVTEDIEAMAFNTAISQMMIFVNAFTNAPARPVSAMRVLLQLLNPFAPHITEELWEKLRGTGIPAGAMESLAGSQCHWPSWDEKFLVEDEVEIPIQVNGKLRDKVIVKKEATPAEVEQLALAAPKLQEHLAGKTVRKVIVVPGKLVNIVV